MLIALTLLLTGCSDKGRDSGTQPTVTDGGSTPTDGGTTLDGGSDGGSEETRWTGPANVVVVDPDGVAVPDAWVMLGGANPDDWVLTGADGTATLDVTDDGMTDRFILAGLEGWISGGANLRETEAPDDPVTIEINPLPDADNADYSWQPGGNGDSPTSAECGHCHLTKGDDWATSAHRDSARNSHTWDLYTGAASTLSEDDCAALGGWMAEGVEPGGDTSTTTRCYVGGGVLDLLNDGCGEPDQAACDHPDQRAGLDAFGSCGDCHAPAVDGGIPGQIDLAATTGIAWDEGVTCDFCHKIRAVAPGPAPGLDGAITLERPSQPTLVTGQEFDPITFGPYPDVVVGIMKGSYAPDMRSADWCSSCHEYARGALSADMPVDSARWPEGLPLHETWSELNASPYGDLGLACHSCHMPVLDEESSTYDLSSRGVNPSVDQGWLRERGEVRHHHFPASGELEPPDLSLDVDWDATGATVQVEVFNGNAAHAVPSGEPMRQLVVLVEAVDGDGQAVTAIDGPTVPDVGGFIAMGTVGVDLVVDGTTVTLTGTPSGAPVAMRFVRPTGTWMDDAGPGTGWFDSLPAEDKGLPILTALGTVDVIDLVGGTVTLGSTAPALQEGDIAYLVGEHDLAGAPGWLYAKTLVDRDGARGVAHHRAVDIASDNRLGVGVTGTTDYRVEAPGGTVSARLVRRRYAAPVAARHGWDPTDSEVATDSAESD